MPDNKKKEETSLRVVKPKTKKFGLSVPVVRYPHDDFLAKPDSADEATPPTVATPPTTVTEPTQVTAPTPPTLPTSLEKDYGKLANSIIREGIAKGVFIGKSQHVYLFLYFQTRAAIQPKRSVRVTKGKLMRGSGIGSERTLLKNVKHLKDKGYLKVTEFDGQHDGNEYEVFVPEEIKPTPPTPPTARQSPYAGQKVGTVPPVESGVSGVAQMPVDVEQNESVRLSFKDNIRSDDEAFAGFIEIFQNFSRKLHDRDLKDLPEIAKTLCAELERVDKLKPITDIDKFGAEHLRRVFARARAKEGTEKIVDTVGKPKKFNLNFELDVLRDLIIDDGFESVYKKIDTYDWTDEQKELVKKTLLSEK